MFRVTGDRKTEYQALEGLSGVVYQQKNYGRCVEYLQKALVAVPADDADSAASQQRLFNKLDSVIQLQFQLNCQQHHHHQPPLVCPPDIVFLKTMTSDVCYPRRARSALGVDTVLTLDVCLFVCLYVSALERKRLIGMT